MKSFSRIPSLKSHRILPGHALASRFTDETSLPGVDPTERRARRMSWTNYRADQRARFGLRDSLGLAGAVLALVLMLSTALAPRTNVLDTTADASMSETIEIVDAAPVPSTEAVRLGS